MTKDSKDAKVENKRDGANKGTGVNDQDQAQTTLEETGETRSVRRAKPIETVGDSERDAQHRQNGTPDQYR